MDGSLVIMERSLFSIFYLLYWMVALSLWKVVCCRYFFIPMDGSLDIMEVSLYVEIFVTPMDESLVIMEGSLWFRFLLLQWMVALSL